MFILIFGKNSYNSRQKIKEIIQEHQDKAKIRISLEPFDSKEFSFEDFKNELRHGSMFEENKIIVLRDVFSNSEFRDKFLEQAKNFTKDKNIFVFYEEKNSSLGSDLLKFFREQGKLYKYDPLTKVDLERWVKKEIIDLGAEISPSALFLLIKSVGSDLWRMSAEVKKLVSYKGKGKKIEKEDVELLVKPEVEAAIFKTIDAIAAKDKKTALALLYKHLEKGDSPFYLLSMIIYQFRNLLLVKDFENRTLPEITTALKPMHPFVVRKSCWLARKFSREQLEEIFVKLFKTDLAIKTGKIKPELALELLIADM